METCLIAGSDLRTLVRAAEKVARRLENSPMDWWERAELTRTKEALERAEQSLRDAKQAGLGVFTD